MTHADIIAAFLRKIIANPADDGPRLTFSDWCESRAALEPIGPRVVQCGT